MAGTLVSLAPGCCVPDCADPLNIQIPGPPGDDGNDGDIGPAGAAAYTLLTAAFVMPGELASAIAAVANSSFLAVNQTIYLAKTDGSVIGTFQVTAIPGATSVTLKNLEDAATGAYAANSAPGSTFTIGSMLVPSGSQGQQASVAGSAIAGDVTGTIGATALTVNSALGALPVGNGTKAISLAKGTDGQILTSDATAAVDLQWKSLLPITAGTDVADNRILRLDSATGLPIPGQSSRVEISDTGAIAAVGSAVGVLGNARGTNAVDLQVTRAGAAQVASGNRSFIGAGENNTASGTESVVVAGDTNSATNNQAAVVAGHDNSATGDSAFIGGGDTNIASGQESTIPGGNNNLANAVQSTVGGGDGNTASGDESVVAGGGANTASAANAAIGGGKTNLASGPYSIIPGGNLAVADKHGQMARAAGGFGGGQGSAQASSLIWRLTTLAAANNMPMFLDGDGGSSLLATIASGRSYAFDIIVSARSSAGVCAAWQIKGAIQNNGGVVSLVSAVTTVLIAAAAAITGTWGVVGNVVVEAVATALNIRVGATVDPAVTVRWCAEARMVEMTH